MNKIFTILLLILISILSIGCGKTSDISESAKGTVETIFDFYSPELDRNCTVTIYLPPNYAQSELSYPVIYMFDGQTYLMQKLQPITRNGKSMNSLILSMRNKRQTVLLS